MAEVTFSDFTKLAKRRGHNPESLAELFRGKIEDPREFFGRVMAGRFKHEDRSAVVIPYRSVINWHRQECHFFKDSHVEHRVCACGCGLPVFDRKKWASCACRKKIQRQNITDSDFASRQVPENVDVKVGQNRGVASYPLAGAFEA